MMQCLRFLRAQTRTFARAEAGASTVEFAVVATVFLLLSFGLIDFARMGYSSLMAEKATERAVRLAVVRAPACDDVAKVTGRSLLGALGGAQNGTQCTAQAGLCVAPATVSCDGDLENPTVAAIWGQVAALLPATAAPENLLFTYHYVAALNRVAAPYNPVVTVELNNLTLDYIFPLAAMASAAGARNADELGGAYIFQSMSASLPAETIR